MKCSQFVLFDVDVLPGAAVPLSSLITGCIPGAGDIEAGSTQPLPSQSSWPGRALEGGYLLGVEQRWHTAALTSRQLGCQEQERERSQGKLYPFKETC